MTYVAVFAKFRPIINVKDLQKEKLRYDVHRLERAPYIIRLAGASFCKHMGSSLIQKFIHLTDFFFFPPSTSWAMRS